MPLILAQLHHIALSSPEPERLASFYERAMGFSIARDNRCLVCLGPERRLVISHGPAKHLSYAAFAVPSLQILEELIERLDRHGYHWKFSGSPLMRKEAVCLSDPDGNQLIFGLTETEEQSEVQAGSSYPARLQHIVFASRNAEQTARFYETVLGFSLTDNVVDDAGVIRTSFLRGTDEHHNLAVFQAATNGLDHHCYEAGEWLMIRDWADHMASQRIPLKWGPGRHGPGNNLFIFIHDPDGNWIEISAELEKVAEDRPVCVWPHNELTLNSWGVGYLRS